MIDWKRRFLVWSTAIGQTFKLWTKWRLNTGYFVHNYVLINSIPTKWWTFLLMLAFNIRRHVLLDLALFSDCMRIMRTYLIRESDSSMSLITSINLLVPSITLYSQQKQKLVSSFLMGGNECFNNPLTWQLQHSLILPWACPSYGNKKQSSSNVI